MAKHSIGELESVVAAAFVRCKTSEANAAIVAKALVAAEADGLKGHGLSRVPSYAAQSKVGKIDGHASAMVTRPKPGIVAVDASNGFAYPAIEAALAVLPEVAKAQGIAAAPIRRSHHCGCAGHPVERLGEQGLVAMLFANTPAAIAPWGGKTGLFGTNPIAFACPVPGAAPIVVDLSISKVARGNILAAKQKGETIPEGWALDKNGQPTTDPAAALAGTMVPFGDAKGTVLALMVELLAAGLVGARYASEATSFLDDKGGPPGTGQLMIVCDPGAFAPAALERFATMAALIEGEPGARLPGARRIGLREAAAREGLVIADALLAEIAAL